MDLINGSCNSSSVQNQPSTSNIVSRQHQKTTNEEVQIRSATHGRVLNSLRSVSSSNQPNRVEMVGQRRRCENMRENQVPKIRDVDHEIAELFINHVLPSISAEFSDTIRSIPNEERQAILLQQLRDSMVENTRLVLQNHRMDHCLPTETVNSLTHSYPLLLREIESWHSLAIKKMIPDKRWSCWRSASSSSCMSRLSFSVPFPPTLWAPLANLIKDFGGKCDPIPSASERTDEENGCSVIPGVLPCRDARASNSSLCQIRKCRFPEYAVDVRAFFRHVNDSRNFLPAGSGKEPFEKVVIRKVKNQEPLRGKLKLLVSSKEQEFQIYYLPTTEKVKLTFHYDQVPDISRPRPPAPPKTTTTTTTTTTSATTQSTTAENSFGCNPNVESRLTMWFSSMMTSLNAKTKKCPRLIEKVNNEALAPIRKKRSSLENNMPSVARSRCYLVTKIFKQFPDAIWNSLVERATANGGRYSEEQHIVTFYNRNEVKRFFDQQCTEQPPRDATYRDMRKSVSKKKRTVDVEVLVSNDMPFQIEKTHAGRVQLKYFTGLVT